MEKVTRAFYIYILLKKSTSVTDIEKYIFIKSIFLLKLKKVIFIYLLSPTKTRK
jgi:hypothetical protein